MKNPYIYLVSIILMFFIISGSIFSQDNLPPKMPPESNKYFLSGSIGIADFHQKDEYLMSGAYRGAMFSSAISFGFDTERFKHEVDMRFSIGDPSVDLKGRDTREKSGYFSYSFLYNSAKTEVIGQPLGLLFGAGLSSFAMNTDLIAGDLASINSSYDQSWYWSHSLNFLFEGEYLAAKGKSFRAKISLPVFSLVSRPENGHWLNSDNLEVQSDNFLNAATQGKSEWLWDNLALHLELEYRQAINSRFDLSGKYLFYYASSDRPFAMGMYANHFLFGLGWKL